MKLTGKAKEGFEKYGELYKPVRGFSRYGVSNIGNVHSIDRGKVLKPFKDTGGYYRVKLFGSGKPKQIGVHQLVAVAFLGHEINGYEKVVDHIDGDITNNKAWNLQVTTQLHNHEKGNSPRKSKHRGVYHCPNRNSPRKWRAEIYKNGKRNNLGQFETELEAQNAYQQARNAAVEKLNELINNN